MTPGHKTGKYGGIIIFAIALILGCKGNNNQNRDGQRFVSIEMEAFYQTIDADHFMDKDYHGRKAFLIADEPQSVSLSYGDSAIFLLIAKSESTVPIGLQAITRQIPDTLVGLAGVVMGKINNKLRFGTFLNTSKKEFALTEYVKDSISILQVQYRIRADKRLDFEKIISIERVPGDPVRHK